MHGKKPHQAHESPCFGPFRLVAILHFGRREDLARRGFGLVEALVALVVLYVGVLGVASLALSSRRLAELAATRTAQTMVARRILDPADPASPAGGSDTVTVGRRRLAVRADTTRVHERLVEIRLVVAGGSVGGDLEIVTRRITAP